MKRKSIVVIMALIILMINVQSVAAEGLNINASSGILLEEKTGRVLWEKNADDSLPMASTTKIMTAIVAIEYGNLDDIVTIDPDSPYIEGTSIYLKKDDKISLEDLIYGLMLRSGNDAAHAIAVHVGGSEENFVELMNRKAKVIGATSTSFANPHGLHDDGHFTTARDLALITRYAFKNETFKEIVSTEKRDITINGEKRTIYNKNRLLNGYEGGNGVKTGYTTAAGKCLVFSAERDNMQLLGVVLNAEDIWTASVKVLDYGFNEYSTEKVMENGEYLASIHFENGINRRIKMFSDEDIDIPVKQGENIIRKLNINQSLEAPVFYKQEVGTVEFYIGDELVYLKKLYCPQKVYERDYKKFLMENIYNFFDFNTINNLERKI